MGNMIPFIKFWPATFLVPFMCLCLPLQPTPSADVLCRLWLLWAFPLLRARSSVQDNLSAPSALTSPRSQLNYPLLRGILEPPRSDHFSAVCTPSTLYSSFQALITVWLAKYWSVSEWIQSSLREALDHAARLCGALSCVGHRRHPGELSGEVWDIAARTSTLSMWPAELQEWPKSG